MSSARTRQHWIPRFLLRNFVKNNHIGVLDKHGPRLFPTTAGNICCASGHFDYGFGNFTADTAWTSVENKARPVIQTIVEQKSIDGLSDNQRLAIARFVVGLDFSSPNTKKNGELRFANDIGGRKSLGLDTQGFSGSNTEAQQVFAGAVDLSLASDPYYVLKKTWTLAETDARLLIGDSPVGKFNFKLGDSEKMNVGLDALGVCIYLPLSSSLLLVMKCSSVRQLSTTVEDDITCFSNKLQTYWAERFVLGTPSCHELRLAYQSLQEYPEVRKGPRTSNN